MRGKQWWDGFTDPETEEEEEDGGEKKQVPAETGR